MTGVKLSAPPILEDVGEMMDVVAEAVAGPRANWKRKRDQLAQAAAAAAVVVMVRARATTSCSVPPSANALVPVMVGLRGAGV